MFSLRELIFSTASFSWGILNILLEIMHFRMDATIWSKSSSFNYTIWYIFFKSLTLNGCSFNTFSIRSGMPNSELKFKRLAALIFSYSWMSSSWSLSFIIFISFSKSSLLPSWWYTDVSGGTNSSGTIFIFLLSIPNFALFDPLLFTMQEPENLPAFCL